MGGITYHERVNRKVEAILRMVPPGEPVLSPDQIARRLGKKYHLLPQYFTVQGMANTFGVHHGSVGRSMLNGVLPYVEIDAGKARPVRHVEKDIALLWAYYRRKGRLSGPA